MTIASTALTATLTTLTGGNDNDVFNLKPSSTTPYFVNGGPPVFEIRRRP